MVRLGHDVLRALVVDPLEPLVVVHEHLAGADGEAQRECELVRVGGLRTRSRPWRRSRGVALDREVADLGAQLGDRWLNVIVCFGSIRGLRTMAPMPPLRSFGSVTRQVVAPVDVPVLVTVMLTVSPVPSGLEAADDASREGADACDGQAREDREQDECHQDADDDRPVDLRGGGSLSPSGLHRSHRAVSTSIRAPQRTQPCRRAGGFGAGSMAAVGVVTWSMVPRNGSRRRRAGGGGWAVAARP